MTHSRHNSQQQIIETELKGFEEYLRYNRKRKGRENNTPISEKSIYLYVSFVDQMIDRIGMPGNAKDIRDYYEKVLLKGYSKNSLVSMVVAMNHWMAYKNFGYRLPLHYAQEVPIVALEEDEVNAIINAALKESNLLYYSLFLVMKESGQRVGDVAAINSTDLDLENLKIGMTIRKLGSVKHEAFISTKTAAAIRTYIHRQRIEPIDSEALWVSKRRNRISNRAINDALKKYAAIAKLRKKVHAHLFRHSTITQAMEYGIPVKSAMTMFRIKSVQTLGRYSHPSEQHLRAEFNKLNGQRPANAAEKPSKTPIINDTEDRKGRLRDKLEEAYVLGNIDKEAYDEGMRRIEELATDQ